MIDRLAIVATFALVLSATTRVLALAPDDGGGGVGGSGSLWTTLYEPCSKIEERWVPVTRPDGTVVWIKTIVMVPGTKASCPNAGSSYCGAFACR
jgi:hypothetical protein